MNLTLITSLAAATLAAAGAWAFEDARHRAALAELRLDQSTAALQAQATARAAEQSITRKYTEALNAAQTRQATLRADADSARAESERLREQTADAGRRLAAAPPAAVLEYATATGELLAECSRSYQGLAAAADGHASDVRTLIDAWPRNQ
ncbi:hypothetical protein PSQ39_06610 [Curvibacter sp. HBC28]|uniref:DUF2514 family protein n=1 Tax=Curvibacter microcysteis TaxID=3026419 RepID=A0ABT5MCJ1_9BURK|nr:hypothetical protein [Curvibacter sp. HBC28]MDD0814298.1 hypothetical protein [Curvibacter sp. HBC28]